MAAEALMAHRKPLGSSFTSTFDWTGPYPELEDFLVSQANTWYRVFGVIEKENPAKVGLCLERVAEPEQLGDSMAHQFWWYPRTPSGR